MQRMIINGIAMPAATDEQLAQHGSVEKAYLHLRFKIVGVPRHFPAPALYVVKLPMPIREIEPLLVIPSNDIPGDLAKIRKMNRHRFLRWLQKQKGWPGLDLTQRPL